MSLGLVASLLSACSLAPTYKPPATEEVTRYKEAGDWAPAQPADGQQRGPWWEVFGDSKLNDLEAQLDAANPDLQAAVARLEQARAVARRDISNEFLATLNLNWEIDLFGRLRNTAAAARAAAQSSEADTAAVALSLQAELASEYFSLRGDDTTISLLADTIQVYDRAYDLTSNRYNEGIAAATDVDQSDTLRQNARAQLASVRRDRAQLEHAIAVLLGVMPSTFGLEPAQLANSVPALASGLPSALLQRRPDVARAERAVAAANAQIGVARAAWFPVFTLTGQGGFQSISSSQWFKAPSRLWSLGPSAAVPLLDFGARSAVNQQARASYDEAAANYRKTALTAYQEVEDNLAALHHLADEVTADEAASKSAASAATHSDKRWDAGVADYIEVTTTHTAALQEERDAISARVLQLNATVALVRATGGGWTGDRIANL